ncbi:TIGR00366 family protein [Pararhodonellum marinum]|uniref:TIGR00366 family protein n=1 Tax=Pararhodonellum marinum TaxID=2755358 RepID=UPI0018901EB3|nr:TIGR00366 family protein [Pararhodonellum marinum]
MDPKKNDSSIYFPTPFELALWLTLLTLILAIFLTKPGELSYVQYGTEVLGFWRIGFWELLDFTLQMVLILIFGHALALSPIIQKCLKNLASWPSNQIQATFLVAAGALLGGYLNWGFGLILGAVLAKEVGAQAKLNRQPINYALLAASGYLGMMIWHGGLSGSAPLKVAENGHFLMQEIGVIPIGETLLSHFNMSINALILLVLAILLYLMAKYSRSDSWPKPTLSDGGHKPSTKSGKGGIWIGMLMVISGFLAILQDFSYDLAFINLNYINFMLFGLGLISHQNLTDYVKAIQTALTGAAGIILQFPFYAGILGIFKYSGLLVALGGFFVTFSNADTFPIVTFFSASLFNFFIPSGGGQWAIQGPVMIEAAKNFDLEIPKMIMIMAYGDQVSNMLQPFWALPLMAITGVTGKELFKYTSIFFLVGTLVFLLGILIWF